MQVTYFPFDEHHVELAKGNKGGVVDDDGDTTPELTDILQGGVLIVKARASRQCILISSP